MAPRYNIAPGQPVLVFRGSVTGRHKAAMMHWGYPSPARGQLVNARVETIASKLRNFRQGFAARRCLIPADGFYEWQKNDAHRQPYFIHRRDEQPFAFAGIWRLDPDRPTAECLIIVQAAGNALRQIHNRQPLRLEPDAWEAWLSTKPVDPAKIAHLLAGPSADDWVAVPVSSYVNQATSDDPRCITPSEVDWPRLRR